MLYATELMYVVVCFLCPCVATSEFPVSVSNFISGAQFNKLLLLTSVCLFLDIFKDYVYNCSYLKGNTDMRLIMQSVPQQMKHCGCNLQHLKN